MKEVIEKWTKAVYLKSIAVTQALSTGLSLDHIVSIMADQVSELFHFNDKRG